MALTMNNGQWIQDDDSWACSVCHEENACAYNKYLGRFDRYCPQCGAKMDSGVDNHHQRELWERLKAYEETGLPPEQVQKMRDNPMKMRVCIDGEVLTVQELADRLESTTKWIRVGETDDWQCLNCGHIEAFFGGTPQEFGKKFCGHCGSRASTVKEMYVSLLQLEQQIQAQLTHEIGVDLTFSEHQRSGPNYSTVKALAAVYELQDYLAGEIAARK